MALGLLKREREMLPCPQERCLPAILALKHTQLTTPDTEAVGVRGGVVPPWSGLGHE